MTHPIRYRWVALAALGLSLISTASAAEIPPGRAEEASAPAQEGGKADTLDRVESAELARSDPAQRGGDHDPKMVKTVILVTAIVILLILL